jgi:hypothetical protein
MQDLTPIYVALITGIFSGIVAPLVNYYIEVQRTRIRYRAPIRLTDFYVVRWRSATIGLVAGAVAGFVIALFVTSPCPPLVPTRIRITDPVDNGTMLRMADVKGTACHVPKDRRLWLLALPEGASVYHPQAGPVEIVSDVNWLATAPDGLYDPIGVGRRFILIAVLADSKASSDLKDYLDKAKSTGRYPGLERLPDGAVRYHQVIVTRK